MFILNHSFFFLKIWLNAKELHRSLKNNMLECLRAKIALPLPVLPTEFGGHKYFETCYLPFYRNCEMKIPKILNINNRIYWNMSISWWLIQHKIIQYKWQQILNANIQCGFNKVKRSESSGTSLFSVKEEDCWDPGWFTNTIYIFHHINSILIQL